MFKKVFVGDGDNGKSGFDGLATLDADHLLLLKWPLPDKTDYNC